MQGQRTVNFAVAGDFVHLLEVPVQAGVIVICPPPSFVKRAPRQVSQHFAATGELVQREFAPEVRVIFKDEPDVVDGSFNSARLLVQLQVQRPIEVIALIGTGRGRTSQAAEIADSGIGSFLCELAGDLLVLQGEVAHRRVGREPVRGCVWVSAVIEVAELVQANQVKGVDEPAAAGVGGVVAVQKHPVVVHHRSAGRAAAKVGVSSSGIIHRRIDTIKVGVHCAVDVVCPAERAHHAAFAQWVALLHRQFLIGVVCAGDLRPLRDIAPVPVLLIHQFQQAVRGEHLLISEGEDILAVFAAARPVHQPCGLKRGRVCKLHADERCHIPCQRLILICRDRAVKGQQNTQSGACR